MRVAILSFDHLHSTEYASALRDTPGVEVIATDPGFRERPTGQPGGPLLAAELGIGYADNYEAVWAWQPDAVVICSTNRTHRELALLAMEHGAHVLCEKPLGVTEQEAADLVRAAERAGLVLMSAYPVRFSPAYAELRSAVQRGLLGTVVSISATNCGWLPSGSRSWFTDPSHSGGGAVMDHVVHVADLLADLLGAGPEDVYAAANSIPQGERLSVETGAVLSLGYADGVVATIDCSWSKPGGQPDSGDLVTLAVVGTDGVAEIAPFAELTPGWSEARGALALSHAASMDAMLISAFLDAVRGRDLRAEPSGRAGSATVAVVDAAYRSLRSGVPERVEP